MCFSYLFFVCCCCYYYYDDDEITSKEIVFHVMDRYSSIFLLPFRIIGWIGRANRVRGGILSNVQGCGICSFLKKKEINGVAVSVGTTTQKGKK